VLALEQNPDVRVARLELAESRARRGEARSVIWPQLRYASAVGQSNNLTSLLGSGGASATEDLSTVLGRSQAQFGTLRLSGTMTLWDWGRNGSQIEIASADELVAYERLRGARQDVAYSVRAAYLALVSARGSSRIAAQAAARAEAHFVAARKRQLRGVETELAVLQREARALALQQEASKAARAEREAEAQLALVLGADPKANLAVVPYEGGPADLPAAEEAVARALAARPDLRIAAIQLANDELRRDAEGRSQLPGLYLSASGGALASTVSGLVPDIAVTTTLAGPLFDGFKGASSQERYGLAVARARQQRDRAATRAAVEVETARNMVLEAIDRQRLAEREAEVATRALAAEKSQQAKGVATQYEVLDAELAVLQAEQRASQAYYDRTLAEARLAKAMGEDPQETRLDEPPSGWKAP